MAYRNGQYEGHGYDLWRTPAGVIAELTEEFGALFDPCPINWDGVTDGLKIDWPLDQASFVNPPYSNMKE